MKRVFIGILLAIIIAGATSCFWNTEPKKATNLLITKPIVVEEVVEVEEVEEVMLITDRENNSFIESIEIKPACIYGDNGGEIYFKYQKVPKGVVVEIREPDEKFRVVADKGNILEGYIPFSICEKCKPREFTLLPDRAYIMRMGFKLADYIDYSNDYLINTTNGSELRKRKCSDMIKLTGWTVKENE